MLVLCTTFLSYSLVPKIIIIFIYRIGTYKQVEFVENLKSKIPTSVKAFMYLVETPHQYQDKKIFSDM